MKKQYTKETALAKIRTKRGVHIEEDSKTGIGKIDFSSAKERIGNGTWGAVDFLRKEHKYAVVAYPEAT